MSSLMINKNKYINNIQWEHHGKTTSKQRCFNVQGTAINLYRLCDHQCYIISYQASVITKWSFVFKFLLLLGLRTYFFYLIGNPISTLFQPSEICWLKFI